MWTAVVCLVCSGTAHSQIQSLQEFADQIAHCTPPPAATETESNSTAATSADAFNNNRDQLPDDAVVLSADSANSDPDDPEQIILNGTINIRHQDDEITAENARFNTRDQTAVIDGEVTYQTEGLEVNSSNATLDVEDGTLELGESGYSLNNADLISRGRAKKINRNEEGNLRLKDATYTSCPAGDNGWLISSDSIRLNPDSGIGTARNVTLRFKDVPIFYAPFFSFPISNQRKTGFLAPRFDQNEKTGLEYRQPFYWNIRPDTDATFTVRTMSDRGIQLQSEFRHLNEIGSWILNQEFIATDRRFITDESRHYTRLRHLGSLSSRWTTSVDINNVSDREYFEDLGDTLKIASITHLERRGDITYTAENYYFRARLLSYQTVDEAIEPDERPYKQLPQLVFDYQKSFDGTGLNATLDTEAVFFDRDDSVRGTRIDIRPRLEWNIHRTAWYSSVAGSVRQTNYELRGLSSQDRTVPVFSTEAGLFFDRPNADGGLLTLEPRFYYLYARRTDQDEIPVFDTAALDFNFSQLFRENSFSGADRINDANQLTLAFSSRRLNSNGRETFQASLGQILYFQDRTVVLPGESIETSSSSDTVAELEIELNEYWSGSSALQWDPNTTTTERSSASIRYRDGSDRLINIGHRFIRDTGEFVNASFAWPVKDNWRISAGWTYSLDEDTSIESVLGVEYEDCCWAFRTAARRYITDDGDDHNNSFFFQLVLKGLAPVGQNVTTVLREAVGGFTARDR